jgi:hypothetical protein
MSQYVVLRVSDNQGTSNIAIAETHARTYC